MPIYTPSGMCLCPLSLVNKGTVLSNFWMFAHLIVKNGDLLLSISSVGSMFHQPMFRTFFYTPAVSPTSHLPPLVQAFTGLPPGCGSNASFGWWCGLAQSRSSFKPYSVTSKSNNVRQTAGSFRGSVFSSLKWRSLHRAV